MTFGPSYGFFLSIRDANAPPRHVVALRSGLDAAFPEEGTKLESRPSLDEGALDLSIGAKRIE